MLKHVLKWLGAIIAVVVIAIAVFLTNIVWVRPWGLNLFYEKVFAKVLFDHNYPVNQLFGVQNQFPSFMANTHRLLSRKNCDYYVMRLDALPKKFDQFLDGLKIREQKQIPPPHFVVEEVLKEMT